MIEIDRRIKVLRAELNAAEIQESVALGPGHAPGPVQEEARRRVEAARIRLDLLCDLRDEAGIGRLPEFAGGPVVEGDELCEGRPDFERSLHLVVTERLEDGSYGWDCMIRTPDGRLLAGTLSDDMPVTPGDAVQSAGRMLDLELASERWNELWNDEKKVARARLTAAVASSGGQFTSEVASALEEALEVLAK